MMQRITYIFLLIILLGGQACQDNSFLNEEPNDVLSEAQVWSDQTLILGLLADLYNRIPEYQTIENWWNYSDFDEVFGSAYSDYWRQKNTQWNYDEWAFNWDNYYTYLREINLFIQKADSDLADWLDEDDRNRYIAEAKLIRAMLYFEMVKRVGGVPLITEPLTYDFSGDPTYLEYPRAKESEIYDFILSELESILDYLPNDVDIKGRATQGLNLAMSSRVALYAASIAKYGANTPEVSLPGGEVGIEESKANDYYRKSLEAAEKLLKSSIYSYELYFEDQEDLSSNFANIFLKKTNNSEVIFVKDFQLQSGVTNNFTVENQPWSGAEDMEGGRMNPSLNLVQSFEKLDNTFELLELKDENGDYLYYDDPIDLFKDRDARLMGTVLVPGSSFKNKSMDIWAGYILDDGTVISGDTYGARKVLPDKNEEEKVVGMDGPINSLEFTAQSGFYCRKYLDPTTGSGQRGVKSEVWWVRYRLGEVYLNAAEAAFELGDKSSATDYLNTLRYRAGFTKVLTEGDITFDRIVHERKVELAFEGHQLWDMKRWRLAHKIWNGDKVDLTKKPWKADEVSNRVYALWPYKYYNPGDENDGKYIFKIVLPAEVTGADYFRMGNYYSYISDEVRNNNPLIVINPNQ
nr:RagB/SusD family nutrient uptake outer membrane protein [uncultured Carboxylicivirga sp.]